MTPEERNAWIRHYYLQGVSLAGVTSLLYVKGLEGIKYQELRKIVFKEIQRLDSEKSNPVDTAPPPTS